MTWNLFFLLLGAAGLLTLGFIPGHHFGRRSRRHDYPDGWDAGVAAERERWEHATGASWDSLNDWNAARSRRPGPADTDEWEAWRQNGEPPSADVLLRTAELDQMAAEYNAAQSRAPVVADITDAARWRPFEDETPTITGVVIGSPQDHTGPEWLESQMAAMDTETAAYLRRVEAEMSSFRRGISA